MCEERNLRRGEREKAEADLKSALQRAHLEAQEEIKRQADVFLRQHKEQQEVISKLQVCALFYSYTFLFPIFVRSMHNFVTVEEHIQMSSRK